MHADYLICLINQLNKCVLTIQNQKNIYGAAQALIAIMYGVLKGITYSHCFPFGDYGYSRKWQGSTVMYAWES